MSKQTDEAFQKIVDWRVKNEILIDNISRLEKLQDFPIFAIATFLLKTQLIEFELKQLVFSLDLHLSFHNTSAILERKTRTPKDLDDQRLTLGALSIELSRFRGKFLDNLKKSLSKLVGLRNKFVHQLFTPGSMNDLLIEAKEGLNAANETLACIKEANGFAQIKYYIENKT